MTPERWQQVEALFQQALERAPEQRAAFLDEACTGDPLLRRQVDALLASDAEAPSFLETPAFKTANRWPTDARMESLVGRRIGPYQVLREIGHGGMGAVYLAERADEQFRKQVAIKLVPRGMTSDALRRRFHKEQQILAQLDHPNIAKLLDGGTTDEGLSYFIMDYVEGLPIDSYCDAHQLTTVARLELFRTVCTAVDYAHQHGVVHRDLKPGNILVTAKGAPKLLDFGIAKVLSPELSSETTDTTATAWRAMTPEYASPEQVRGEPITPASDVYSLGVLLYKLLTGHHPYGVQHRTPPEMERIICEEEPEKPSTVINRVEQAPRTADKPGLPITPEAVSAVRDGSPEKLRRQLAGDIDTIVLMALRKEPERRYAAVQQFAGDIGRYLEGRPVLARPDTLVYRGAKFIKRNKIGVLAAGLVAGLLGVIGVEEFYRLPRRAPVLEKAPETAVRPKAMDSIAVLPLENLSGDATQEYFADGMTEALITDLAQIGALRVISRTSVMRYKGTRQPLPEIARALNVDAVVEGSVLRSGERVRVTAQLIEAATDRHLWAKTYERDLRDILALQGEVASAIAQEIKIQLTPQEQVRLASSRPVNPEAHEAYLKGRYYWNKRTRESSKRGIDYFQQALEKDPSDALAYAGLADSYITLSFESDVAPQYFPKAKEAVTRALERDDTLAEVHVSLANILTFYDWDWPGAEREYRRALELNPSYAIGHRFYAGYLAGMGRHREAIAEAKRAQELDPLAPNINELAGRCFYFARQYDQALEQNRKALEIDPNFWIAHLFSGRAYALKGMYAEALAELQKAREGTAEVLSNIGFVYAISGRPRQSQRILEELISLSKQRYVPSWHIMKIYLALGQKDQAFAWLEKAFQEREGRLLWLKVEPMLDDLRSDPRFAEFLQRLRFPP